MRIGKLSDDQLRQLVLGSLPRVRGEVLLRPGTGVDCGALRVGEMAVVASTDPITAGGSSAGALSIHVSANDVAAAGAEPMGVFLTVLAPPDCGDEELERAVRDAAITAAGLRMEIIGGHTEVTDAVNRIVLSTTVLGLAPAARLLSAAGGRPGMELVLTKWAALEGTMILAKERGTELGLTPAQLAEAESLAERISVVPEGRIAADFGAAAMHDATEGGVLGAAWELASASGCGLELYPDRIPLLALTEEICGRLGLDPLRLIASGSLLIAVADGRGLVEALAGAGIPAAVIGRLLPGRERILVRDGARLPLEPPGADELYQALGGAV